MPFTPRLRPTPAARQTRLAAPRCRGGASSLLRLAPPSAPRLPSSLDISDWVMRAAHALKPALPGFAPSEFKAG